MIRIYSKDALRVNLKEEKACAKLISSGSIYTLYVECCDIRNKVKHRVFIAKENGVCIGWSIIKEIKNKKTHKFEFMVYIKKKFRRLGIGTKLYKKSRRFFKLKDKDIKVYTTTNSNISFFSKLRKH
jgi:ribosomal protein S18 acetylase RimI-like enzyme